MQLRELTSGLRKFFSLTRKKSFGLNGLDLKLAKYVRRRNGFFVEAGANNGLAQSNTLFFERYRGWTGLLIEPVPDLAEKCRANRPGCFVQNCALVPFQHKEPTIAMRYCNLMSLVRGAMDSEEAELEHLRVGCELQDVTTYDLIVPAMPLSSVLEAHAIQRVDLLCLDVEGFELSALKGIDFDRHSPTFMLIEARYRREIDSFLSPLYDTVAELSHHDVLYARKGLRRQ